MPTITLICTAHRENGSCNAAGLVKILQAIGPAVVFEETSPADFDSYYQHKTMQKLESQAIAEYSQVKDFRQVPVDRYEMPSNFFHEMQRVFDYIGQSSEEYVVLNEENARRAYTQGFSYLNSAACNQIMARISLVEEQAIFGSGDDALLRGFEKWRRFNQCREREMIRNVYEYCRRNAFGVGVFLAGAAHRIGIVRAIENYVQTEVGLINWDLSPFRS